MTDKLEQSDNAITDSRPMTFGEKLVGLTFNPSGDQKVQRIKELAAEMADLLEEVNRTQENSYLGSTFYGGAIRRILDAQMYSVKFLTNKY
jgi:hypothetical protein